MATVGKVRRPPLVVIVGPTASGKTALAIRLAKQFDGEIISADSRAVYRGLSIGTAKPSSKEQAGIPHWGVDIVNPDERYTVAQFQQYADAKIEEICARDHVPVLVGGTGLYIDAVIYHFQFPAIEVDTVRRDQLMEQSLEQLHEYCYNNNITLPENRLNKRHVVQSILRNGKLPQRGQLMDDTIVVGITTEKEILENRITHRARQMIEDGVIQEARDAAGQYGWNCEAMSGNVYPLVRKYDNHELSRAALERQFIVRDRQLAKRQMTWFRRNKDIHWLTLDGAYTYLVQYLGVHR